MQQYGHWLEPTVESGYRMMDGHSPKPVALRPVKTSEGSPCRGAGSDNVMLTNSRVAAPQTSINADLPPNEICALGFDGSATHNARWMPQYISHSARTGYPGAKITVLCIRKETGRDERKKGLLWYALYWIKLQGSTRGSPPPG